MFACHHCGNKVKLAGSLHLYSSSSSFGDMRSTVHVGACVRLYYVLMTKACQSSAAGTGTRNCHSCAALLTVHLKRFRAISSFMIQHILLWNRIQAPIHTTSRHVISPQRPEFPCSCYLYIIRKEGRIASFFSASSLASLMSITSCAHSHYTL